MVIALLEPCIELVDFPRLRSLHMPHDLISGAAPTSLQGKYVELEAFWQYMPTALTDLHLDLDPWLRTGWTTEDMHSSRYASEYFAIFAELRSLAGHKKSTLRNLKTVSIAGQLRCNQSRSFFRGLFEQSSEGGKLSAAFDEAGIKLSFVQRGGTQILFF